MKLKYSLIVLALGTLLYAEQGKIDMHGGKNSTLNVQMSYGKVLEVIAVPGFKYLKVEENGNEAWVGIMDVPVPVEASVGDMIGYDTRTIMKNYKSKLLNREFKEIIFASKVELLKKKVEIPSSIVNQTNNRPKNTIEEVKKAPKAFSKKDSYTVEELYAFSENLNGQTITIRGKVSKVSKGIMGKDWVHLSDGTGSETHETNDLTLTTQSADMYIGENVTAKGKLVKNKDFGSGYFYKVIIEEAIFTK